MKDKPASQVDTTEEAKIIVDDILANNIKSKTEITLYELLVDTVLIYEQRLKDLTAENEKLKSEVKEFAEWCNDNTSSRTDSGWVYYDGEYRNFYKTTEELYQLFKQR
ncbi:MAG TPA: hypothetical protein VFF27_00110 [Bacteroidia bacterium]|jgi:predicted RNA methylase|nr:hypothetical protein [Bacteroidia bacterium]